MPVIFTKFDPNWERLVKIFESLGLNDVAVCCFFRYAREVVNSDADVRGGGVFVELIFLMLERCY